MSPLDRTIAFLMRTVPQGSLWERYSYAVGMIVQQVRKVKAGIPARKLPTRGFRLELHANGQDGEMYRHLYVHIAAYLLGPMGWLFSWGIGLLDIRQRKQGRAESEAEVAGNVAGRECGRILTLFTKGKLDERTARSQLRRVLGE